MTRKVNILYIINSMNNGGAEVLAIRLAKKLDKNKFNVTVCSLSDEGPLKDVLASSEIPFHTLGKKEGKNIGLVFRLRRLLRKEKIDIIHTHNQGPLLYGYLSTRLFTKVLFIHTEHINMEQELSYSSKHLFYNKILLNGIDGFLSIADHVTENIKHNYNLKKATLTTIPNGVDLAEFKLIKQKYSLKEELGLSHDSIIIGNISALREQKDHMTMIQAMELVTRKMTNVVLVIAGEGECEEELRRYVRENKLDRYIVFLGYRSDVRNLLSEFDCFMLTSLYEGLPLCILEAMAAGLPIVATNVNGTNELVIDNTTGFLVPPKEPTILANTITKFLSNLEEAKKMGKAGRELIEQKYNFNDIIQKYENYYLNFFNN